MTQDPRHDISERELRLRSGGYDLAATLYLPKCGRPQRAVQINSAMAAPRQYYRAFSCFLAARGAAVLTYDYRGFAGSAQSAPDDPGLRLSAWGTEDQAAASSWLLTAFPALPRAIVGHSVGGQILGLSSLAGSFDRYLLVSSAHGYWGRWPGLSQRLKAWWWWKIRAPRELLRQRSLPAAIFGAALPMHVGLELARYCLHPDFFCDTSGEAFRPYNAEIRGPLQHYIFSDDKVVPPGAEMDLKSFFPRAQHTTRALRPEHFDVDHIGHFGFFRRSAPATLWRQAAEWIEAQEVALSAGPPDGGHARRK